MDELDFTIEFKSFLEDELFEAELMEEADSRLRELARGHNDMTGAAVTVRQQAAQETPIYEAAVVAYVRPTNLAGKEKDESPRMALRHALDAVERQVREKRERLRERWEEPGKDPVTQEVAEIVAAEAEDEALVEKKLKDEE